jgi:hypothetical protein
MGGLGSNIVEISSTPLARQRGMDFEGYVVQTSGTQLNDRWECVQCFVIVLRFLSDRLVVSIVVLRLLWKIRLFQRRVGVDGCGSKLAGPRVGAPNSEHFWPE